MANKISLSNGCIMSTPSVSPKNWKTGGDALLKKTKGLILDEIQNNKSGYNPITKTFVSLNHS